MFTRARSFEKWVTSKEDIFAVRLLNVIDFALVLPLLGGQGVDFARISYTSKVVGC